MARLHITDVLAAVAEAIFWKIYDLNFFNFLVFLRNLLCNLNCGAINITLLRTRKSIIGLVVNSKSVDRTGTILKSMSTEFIKFSIMNGERLNSVTKAFSKAKSITVFGIFSILAKS